MIDSSERNLRLYPWFEALFGTFFWVPVFFLFFNKHLGLENVLLLESIYFFSVVTLEIPSGYFSDTFGRRPTLMIASVSLVGAYFLFLIAHSFPVFVAAEVLQRRGLLLRHMCGRQLCCSWQAPPRPPQPPLAA